MVQGELDLEQSFALEKGQVDLAKVVGKGVVGGSWFLVHLPLKTPFYIGFQ